MLLIALGLVLATMRQLNQPSTTHRLEQIFSTPETTVQQQSEHQFTLKPHGQDQTIATQSPAKQPAEPQTADTDADASGLAQVQDNTYFRPSEDGAWFDLIARLQQTDSEQLAAETLGELTYAQLLKQPQVYRGQVVTVRGTVRREEVVALVQDKLAPNKLGIDTYHRLILQPRGGGHWPFVVYCLELPPEFPRGDNLQTPLAVTGFFFKNWSYAWQDGLGIAPVVLAQSVDWQPPAAKPQRRSLTSWGLTQALIAAGLFALLIVSLAIRNTRRPPHLSRPNASIVLPEENFATETIHEQLQRLAETEPDV